MYTLNRIDFIDNEEEFDDLEEAELAAVEHSIDDSPWAVCDTEQALVVAIGYGRQLYRIVD